MIPINKKVIYSLVAILFLSLVLRVYNISNQDILGDESADAFRSVGYLDYLGTNFQTTPIDWYKNTALPWWTKLSFHDDPPATFLTAHIFFSIFGDSNLVTKSPPILWGVFSTLLIYLILQKFATPSLALLSAFMFAVSGPSIWIFRTSLLEPFLLGALLLNIYCFLCMCHPKGGLPMGEKRYFWLFGLTLGLVAITKYTGVFVLPVYIFYLLSINKKLLFSWRLGASLVLAVLVFSPVIIYNFYLYQARGHFDLQLAYLFHQATPEWVGLVGKTQDGFANIFQNLITLYGLPELILLVLVLFLCVIPVKAGIYYNNIMDSRLRGNDRLDIVSFPRRRESSSFRNIKISEGYIFVFLYLFFLTLMLVKIGVAPRFIVLYLPVFVILESSALYFLWNYNSKLKFLFKLSVIAYIIFTLWFAIQINFVKTYDYGVSKLDQYFIEEFRGKESGVTPQSDNLRLNEAINKFSASRSEAPRHFSLIVYNDNVTIDILEWIYYRYFFYHSIPTMYVENFLTVVKGEDRNLYKDFTIYFVQSSLGAPKNPFKASKKIGDEFEASLISKGQKPVKIIYGKDNVEMFRVYKFGFLDY